MSRCAAAAIRSEHSGALPSNNVPACASMKIPNALRAAARGLCLHQLRKACGELTSLCISACFILLLSTVSVYFCVWCTIFEEMLIGHGAYSVVVLETDDGNCCRRAIKLHAFGPDGVHPCLLAEIATLRLIARRPHECLNQLCSVEFNWRNIERQIALAFPFFDKTVAQLFAPEGPGFKEYRDQIQSSLLRAVAHLHSFTPPVVHRDIKPGNILVDVSTERSQHRVSLCDFGCAALADRPLRGLVGTLIYSAPEMEEVSLYDEKVDVYSSGVVLLEIHGGYRFPTSSRDRCIQLVQMRRRRLLESGKPLSTVGSALCSMTDLDPTVRCTGRRACSLVLSKGESSTTTTEGIVVVPLCFSEFKTNDPIQILAEAMSLGSVYKAVACRICEANSSVTTTAPQSPPSSRSFVAILAAKLVVGCLCSPWQTAVDINLVSSEQLDEYCTWELLVITSLDGDLYPHTHIPNTTTKTRGDAES